MPHAVLCISPTRPDRRARGGILYARIRYTKAGERTEIAATPPAGIRTVGSDLQVLRIMLYWARETRDPATSDWLLKELPMRGRIVVRQEQNKRRPFASHERFATLLHAIAQQRRVAATSQSAFHLRRLQFLEFALRMAQISGRRIQSIANLRRDDFTFNADRGFEDAWVPWRPEHNKRGRDELYPLPSDAAACVYRLLEERAVPATGLCLPQHRKAGPVTVRELTAWLGELEESIGLPKLPGGAWHPFRRQWAKERKHLPVKDVMAAGGWKDTKTLIDCYQEPDRDTMRRVAEEPERARRLARVAVEAEAKPQMAAAGSRPVVRRRPAGVSPTGASPDSPRILTFAPRGDGTSRTG